MWRPGFVEILIVLIIVILLFGPGRISKISKELGSSISAFKEGLHEKDTEKKELNQTNNTEQESK